MNVIFNNDSLSVELNLDINNTYNLINDNSSTTDFGENNTFNFEAVPLSSESWVGDEGEVVVMAIRKLKH
jgi:hypothetical protein